MIIASCPSCHATDLPFTEQGIQVCWCGTEMCPACFRTHAPACTWAKSFQIRDLHYRAKGQRDR